MSPRRVAVIGAGPAGLVAATHSIHDGHHVTVFEQSDQVGGIWVYSEDPKHHSAIYDRMLTNLPKQMMMFNGVPFPEEHTSFMNSQQVLDYLVKYAEGLPIQFNTKVIYVSRKGDEWLMRTEHLGETKEELFDVVFVCNGHYVQPRIPFDTSRFTGKLIHSHDYRRAEDFRGKRVAVIGTGPSGIDIALQLADTATEILFIGNRAKYPVLPPNIIQYSAHVVDMEDDRLTLDIGEELTGVEVAIVCTGYNMDFPFLEKGLVEILHDGQMVSPLWQHVAHKEYPDSLFFIGLNLMVVTNTLFEHQAKFALALVNGKATIPARREMDDWEEKRFKFLADTGRRPSQFHSMTSEQWAYMDELAEIGHFEKWSHHKVMSKMYDYIFTIRSQDVVNYKKVDFHLDGDDFTDIWLFSPSASLSLAAVSSPLLRWSSREMLLLFLLVSFSFSISSASNPPSVVIDLNERFLEVKDDGLWIVKFYAPWCAHCKRLVPTWEHLGHALQDKNLPIRVAKMDCTRFQSACQTMQIRGYPTIFFFRNGKTVEFHGERTKEGLVNFAEKCSADVVEKVNALKISDMRRKAKHDPFFLIVADSDDALREEFVSAAEKLFSKVRFVSAAAESVPQELRDTNAKVAVFKDDILMTFNGQPDDFYSWVLRERWPLLPQALHSNIAEMSTSGKLLVLTAVSDLDRFNMSSPTGQFYDKVATAAKEMKKSEILWEQFQFAWLDGSDIISGIAMTKMGEPAILVFNYTSYEFFMPFDEPEKMTSNSIITWLEQLNDGISSGTAVPLGGRGWLTRTRRLVYDVYTNVAQMFASQPLLSCCLFGVPIAFLSIICYSICSADFSVERDEFYPDEEEEELLTDTEDGQQHENYDPDHQKNE